ncbi:MAG TPA: NADP-dependent oxidoreductase [Actinomycetota bacterium]|nr:NADP-dependent oxidoreductase [Actinomycetota bacterium]
MVTSRRVTLANRPQGQVRTSDFAFDEAELPPLQDGQFRLEVEYLSIDPTIRGWMAYDTYLPKIRIGEVIRSAGAGEVVESRNPGFTVGTRVFGMPGWQTRAVLTGGVPIPPGVTYEQALSVFGVTGLTAYVGLTDIGKPQPGETVVVSGAAGGVGSIAGQIAKIQGARVVGIAGSPQKCQWVVDDLGFDDCIDYKAEGVRAGLRRTCPDGIDVYFDNVGGETLNEVLGRINDHARIILCGAISQYDRETPSPGPANIINAISRRALLQGFIVLDHMNRAPEASAAMGRWLAEGRLQVRNHIREGLDSAPSALLDLFTGANLGKVLVRL